MLYEARRWLPAVDPHSHMKVLITGASGFVGRNLAVSLAASGFEVHGTHRSERPPDVPGVQWHRSSLIEADGSLRDALAGAGTVVHLAALAHQIGSHNVRSTAEFRQVNVGITRTVARRAAELRTGRVIFMSSVAAIGTRSGLAVNDETVCTPVDDYGRSKLEAEAALRTELDGSDTDWCVLRPPLIYGPGNPGNMERLQKLVATGLPLPLAGVRNRRSFIFIDNLVAAITTVIRYPEPIRSCFVLSDGSEFSTPELIRSVGRAAARNVRLFYAPVGLLRAAGRVGDVLRRATGVSIGVDSYSVDRLVSSFEVDGRRFNNTFRWLPPVPPKRALESFGTSR